MQTLYIGPVAIKLSSSFELGGWLEPMRHYLQPSKISHSYSEWQFFVASRAESPKNFSASHFEFKRRGLVFRANESERLAHVYTDGHEADFLAGLELIASLAVESLGGLSIHGAAAAVNGTGYLMPGISGTGKSTAMRNGGFERIVGDERIFLLPNADGWEMISTPFWSAGRAQVPARYSHQLNSVVHLQQAKGFKLAALSTLNSLEWLMRSVVYYGTDLARRDAQLERAVRLAEASSHFRLEFTKRGPWAWTLNQMHFNHLFTPFGQSISQSIFIGI